MTISTRNTLWIRSGLTGGTENVDLDAIDGAKVRANDPAIVKDDTTGWEHLYRANLAGGAAESSPLVIVPDTNPGTINWELMGIVANGVVLYGDSKILDNKKFSVGTGEDFYVEYNATSGRFEFWTTDSDGGGTDKILFSVADAGDLMKFFGKVVVNDTTPEVAFRDENCTDDEDNALIQAQATDTGSGTEDVDVYFKQMIAGVLTTFLHADADGDLDFQDRNLKTTGSVSASAMDLESNDPTVLTVTSNAANGGNLGISDGTTLFGYVGSEKSVTGAGTKDTMMVTSANGKDALVRAPTGRVIRFDIGTTAILSIDATNVEPGADDTFDLGAADKRWDDVYATNTTIQTSDERLKTDFEPLPVGLDFIVDLAAGVKSFRWLDIDEPEVTETRIVSRQKTEPVEKARTIIEEIDGRYVRRIITETVDEPIFELVPLFDEIGNEIGSHRIPAMEEVEETVVIRPSRTKTYHRRHWGVMAQHLDATLLKHGVAHEDCAALIYDIDADLYGVRIGELIPLLIKNQAELATRVKALEGP